MSPKKDKDSSSEDYRISRARNNVAVQKSREKAKLKADATAKRVKELRKRTAILEGQIIEMKNSKRRLKEQLLKKYENNLDKLTDEQKIMLAEIDSSDSEEL
ncbi:unnamed protein product [Diamesa tonsa]